MKKQIKSVSEREKRTAMIYKSQANTHVHPYIYQHVDPHTWDSTHVPYQTHQCQKQEDKVSGS